MSEKFGINQTNPQQFQMFNSTKYGGYKDQIFSDSTVKLVDVGGKDSYDKWLGLQYQSDLKALHYCDKPVDPTDDDPKASAGTVSSLVVLVVSAAVFTVLTAWIPPVNRCFGGVSA